jgi:hypothetical protein
MRSSPSSQGPEPRREREDRGAERDSEDHRMSEHLAQWASRSPHRSNFVAVGVAAAMMVWLLMATRDRPDQASIVQGAALVVFSLHALVHFWIVVSLNRLKERGIAGAHNALRAYLARVTHLQLAIAWGLLALIASL